MNRVKEGKNHKGEPVLKVYSEPCPICNHMMIYFEFLFDIPGEINSDLDKLVRKQQIEAMIDKIKKGEKLSYNSILIGCIEHYSQTPKEKVDKMFKKPYITIDAEDVWKLSNTPISHIYFIQPIS